MTETDRDEVIRTLYRAYSEHDLDAVLAALSPDVDWPNAWEGRMWAHWRSQ